MGRLSYKSAISTKVLQRVNDGYGGNEHLVII